MKNYKGDDIDKSMCVDSGDCAAQSAGTHGDVHPGKGRGSSLYEELLNSNAVSHRFRRLCYSRNESLTNLAGSLY